MPQTNNFYKNTQFISYFTEYIKLKRPEMNGWVGLERTHRSDFKLKHVLELKQESINNCKLKIICLSKWVSLALLN